jgi:hypothetical protein
MRALILATIGLIAVCGAAHAQTMCGADKVRTAMLDRKIDAMNLRIDDRAALTKHITQYDTAVRSAVAPCRQYWCRKPTRLSTAISASRSSKAAKVP